MGYHLGIFNILKAWFFPPNTMLIFVTIIIILATINAGKKSYRDRGTPMFPKSISIFLIFIAIPVFLVGSEFGSGWQLKGDELILKAPPSNASINLKSSSMALMPDSSQWAPESRTMGIGIAGLATGAYTLKNGKNAIVFSYLTGNDIVVLENEGRYYVITYPGIQDLYKELTSRGVKLGAD